MSTSKIQKARYTAQNIWNDTAKFGTLLCMLLSPCFYALGVLYFLELAGEGLTQIALRDLISPLMFFGHGSTIMLIGFLLLTGLEEGD